MPDEAPPDCLRCHQAANTWCQVGVGGCFRHQRAFVDIGELQAKFLNYWYCCHFCLPCFSGQAYEKKHFLIGKLLREMINSLQIDRFTLEKCYALFGAGRLQTSGKQRCHRRLKILATKKGIALSAFLASAKRSIRYALKLSTFSSPQYQVNFYLTKSQWPDVRDIHRFTLAKKAESAMLFGCENFLASVASWSTLCKPFTTFLSANFHSHFCWHRMCKLARPGSTIYLKKVTACCFVYGQERGRELARSAWPGLGDLGENLAPAITIVMFTLLFYSGREGRLAMAVHVWIHRTVLLPQQTQPPSRRKCLLGPPSSFVIISPDAKAVRSTAPQHYNCIITQATHVPPCPIGKAKAFGDCLNDSGQPVALGQSMHLYRCHIRSISKCLGLPNGAGWNMSCLRHDTMVVLWGRAAHRLSIWAYYHKGGRWSSNRKVTE
eukprot:g13824.t1